jgi:hypothetical protein
LCSRRNPGVSRWGQRVYALGDPVDPAFRQRSTDRPAGCGFAQLREGGAPIPMLKDLDDGHRTIVAEFGDPRLGLSTAPDLQAITTKPEPV